MASASDPDERAAMFDVLETLNSNPEAVTEIVATALDRLDHD